MPYRQGAHHQETPALEKIHLLVVVLFVFSACSKRSFFIFLNIHDATSRTSLKCCELSHRVIASVDTWIDVGVLLAEEETMSGANAFFSSRL
ncbi:hypothetical protein SAMN05421736_11042 [Evansella caseinilytica]|uniref:Uncharacterized protein n=1 Tax=Evansella caseinilytica TaxID=1503961 RepID=A0A1H3S6Z1_9BACI|nr:hypothetical protein [Evansella caseinilytica]SDZ33732.1 hypothetical protein SAMN05421736_11042 [Evansella caseinilytica]